MSKRQPPPNPTNAERLQVADRVFAHIFAGARIDIRELGGRIRATIGAAHIRGDARGAYGRTPFEALAKAVARADKACRKRWPK